MRSFYLLPTAALVLAQACAPAIPDSGATVGFDRYDDNRRAQVDAQLEGTTNPGTGRLDSSPSVSESTLDSGSNGGGGDDDIAAMAAAAIDGGGSNTRSSGMYPEVAGPAPGGTVSNSAGISSENDFDAVSSERSIEEDAALVAQNTANYQQIAPEPLPQRPGGSSANVVQYALSTTNSVGQPQYSRGAFSSKAKEARNCAAYSSDDLAQEDFLSSGGPERDRKGLDADGDGFACGWSPAPFRRARG
ncbi:hypothetical protein ATO8_07861 [Roseivivax marinus]|uniref:Excalibur calcium-binding domain-containing protein n=1 Tax=Roseivivax marinus TaxID=1379903 RepID=W4HM99_9RHOB|nr:hypothetical protein [Roseivivax marinus]ETW13110.1 hypothetical protein ATO8_07861 [Roseivivax marinus]UMA63386.1 hypothetical protein LVO79_09965 [Roseivivax marinus]